MSISVSSTQVRCYKIEGLKNLDLVSVYIEDLGKGKGKITLECFGKCWSYFWGSIGDQTIEQFFNSMSVAYLANCFWDHSHPQHEHDFSKVQKAVRKTVIEYRKDGLIDKNLARVIYQISADSWSYCAPVHSGDTWKCPSELIDNDFEYIGSMLDELGIPISEVNDYNYLGRILEGVKYALQLQKE